MTLLAMQRYVPWSWSFVRFISSVPLERMLNRLPSNKPIPPLDLKPNAYGYSYTYICIISLYLVIFEGNYCTTSAVQVLVIQMMGSSEVSESLQLL